MMWLTMPKRRQDHDVDFGVAEEPEQVLVEDRVAAAGGIEERRAEVAVGQQHGDGAGQDGQRQQQQERGHQHRPGEQRHLVQRHARRAHVQDRGDEVDRAQDRRRAGQMQRQDAEVERRAGMAGGRTAADTPSSRRRSRCEPGAPSTNSEMSSRVKDGGSSQNEMLFMRGNAMSGAPIISGTNQLPKPPISVGMTMKNTMIRPWPVTNTL